MVPKLEIDRCFDWIEGMITAPNLAVDIPVAEI